MLEVKHLRKQYRTKNGVVTYALDDVSLTFPEKGMVFILGKSGSGKSTLLNVCGGLDKMDSGEIIIKGKSSNEFSGQDFDSYRNTYVGFVFQEYNILDEFTVEDNIALALELQNKKRDKAVIDKILADVDMTNFAQRKPNTLSGGQKQRVAIARALVKEPEIIMADEPTGALDSKTGQQVFDTLKNLSKDKLVLVISHDREFAEQYGDRIIELKDGKVISDQTRAEDGDGAKNVRFYGTDTVCVTSGADLTDADLVSIKSFLSKAGGAAVISTSRENIARMKEARPEISVGSFNEIKEQPKSKEYPPQKLIRSRLPVKHAVKMGASSLKTKPVRLVFTILLSVVAFILFGLASTLMLFNGKNVTVQTLLDSDYDSIILSKAYYETVKTYNNDKLQYEEEYKNQTNFTFDEFKALQAKYAGAVAAIDYSKSIKDFEMEYSLQQFYTTTLDGFVVVDPSLQVLAGRLPENDDEIAITDYMFDAIKSSSSKLYYYVPDGDKSVRTELNVQGNDYSSVLYSESKPVTLNIAENYFKIVGVYKGASIPGDYAELKSAAEENRQFTGNGMTQYEWQNTRKSGMYSRAAVTEECVKKILQSYGAVDDFDPYKYFNYTDNMYVGIVDENGAISGASIYLVAEYKQDTGLKLLDLYGVDGNPISSLSANEIAIDSGNLLSIYNQAYQDFYYKWSEYFNQEENDRINAAVDEALRSFEEKNPQPEMSDYDTDDEYWKARDQWWADYAEASNQARINASKFKALLLLERQVEASAAERYDAEFPAPEVDTEEYQTWYENKQKTIIETWNKENPINRMTENVASKEEFFQLIGELNELFNEMGITVDLKISSDFIDPQSVSIGGVFFNSYAYSCAYLGSSLYSRFYNDSYTYISDLNSEYETKYESSDDAYISAVYIPYNGDSSIVKALVEYTYEHGDDDSTAMILNPVMSQLEMLIEMAETLRTAFLIVGLVLALFAMLLMFNFISASISSKKKEIGILRAIGARITDVFKIFISEALIIALICFVISTFGTLGLCLLLNATLTAQTFVNVSIFVFSPLSAVCIIAIALFTAAVATILPVALYSRKPPVASIRSL